MMPKPPDGWAAKWPWEDPVCVMLAERDGGWYCSYCQVPLVSCLEEMFTRDGEGWSPLYGFGFPQKDHVIPKSRGGSNEISNLALACSKCNARKGVLSAEEFRRKLAPV